MSCSHEPSSIELIDKMVLDRSRDALGATRLPSFVEGDPGAMLIVEFYGETEGELTAQMDGLKADIGLAYACVNILDRAGQAAVWNLRKGGLGLLMSTRGDAKPIPFVEDPAVDPSVMGEFVRRFDEIVTEHGTTAGYYGHASVGCLHIRPFISLKNQDGIDKMVSIGEAVSDLIKEFGGSMSGEHGDGIVRGVWTRKMFGDQIYNAFRELKQTWDPQGIMNPGKIIDTPPMTENLRYGVAYQPHGAGHHAGLLRRISASQAPWRCATAWEPAASWTAPCARPSWPPATRNTRHEAAPTCSAPPCPAACPTAPRAPSPTTASTRLLTSAWSARPARPSASQAWTWPSSNTSFWITTRRNTACPCVPASSPTSTGLNKLGSRYAPTHQLAGRICPGEIFGVNLPRHQP